MSGNGSNVTSEIRYVVPDAVPDPPRISSDAEIENLTRNTLADKPRENDRSSENETPCVPLGNNNDSADSATTADNNSTTNSQNNSNAKRASKSKKSSKSKTPSKISYNIINSANIRIGPTIKHVYNLNNIQDYNNISHACDLNASESDDPRMSPHIEALIASKLEITKDDMLLVKVHMGHGWKQVAKQIGFSKGQIEQFLENYKHRDEVIYQILLEWKQSCTKDATIGRLVSAIWSSKEYECVELLAAAHSNT